MRSRYLVLMLIALCPILALGRTVQVYDIRTLISKSQLVFVGRVKSIEPSGIRTTLSYPTWKGVTFEWLNCNVEVVEPIKGVRKGELVRTAMLSAPGKTMGFNPPGMVEPAEGKAYLLCLVPTTISNVFAALTAPWDDNQAIFVLDRSFRMYGSYRDGKGVSNDLNEHNLLPADVKKRVETSLEIYRHDRHEFYATLWSLVDADGRLLPAGAEKMRDTYKAEINTGLTSNTVINLQWETYNSPDGWQWDVPKGQSHLTNSTESRRSVGGPVTMPERSWE